MGELMNKVALVVGASGGIGAASALALHRQVWLVKTSYAAVTLANGPSAG